MARIVLSEQTADRIQQLIDKQYKPGDKIPAEMELAAFMDVSRTTIRDAGFKGHGRPSAHERDIRDVSAF